MSDQEKKAFVAYIQQPTPLAGVNRIEVFQKAEDAIAFLKGEFDQFLAKIPDATVKDWGIEVGDCIAVGIIRTYYTSWLGRVVEREVR